MSYVPPAGDAADFTWAGATPYTAPAGGTADLTFFDGYAATGWSSTSFSTPGSTASAPATLAQAAGFAPAAFGAAVAHRAQQGASFGDTQFGTPSSTNGAPAVQAAGFAATTFGTGTAHCTQQGAGFSSTAWGQAASARAQAAQGALHTAFGTGAATSSSASVGTAAPVGTPTAAPPLAYDDFDSGETWLRTYQTLDGSEPWGSITGTVAGGALNPAAFDIWDDVVRLSLSPDSTFRTAGRFFDLTLTTEARASTAGESLFSVSLRQDAGTNDYGVLFEVTRAVGGTGLVRIEAWDNGPPAGNSYGYLYEPRLGTPPFAAGSRHTYRAVSRPGFYELFEDGDLIASIATDSEKQLRPFAAYAMVTTHALAVDSIRLVEYGAVGPGPLVQFGAPTFGQTGVAQGLQVASLAANHHSGGTYHPAGEAIARFGDPFLVKNAVGFAVPPIATPSIPLLVAGIAPGVQLGAPVYIAHRATPLGPVVQIPQAYRRSDHWGRAPSTDFAATFGNVWSYTRMPKALGGWAYGIAPVAFGTPDFTSTAICGASSLGVVQVGSPASGLRLAAADTPTAATFGGPTALVSTSASSSSRVTSFGHPASGQAVVAQDTHRPTRFGVPRSDILGTCKARGFALGRFARPACRIGNFRFAAGLAAPARFGSAGSRNTNRARHIAPIVRFGRNLLRRNTTC